MASSIETRIETFITEHELDPELKEEVQELIIGCIETMFKHLYSIPLSVAEETTKAKKVLKADKIEDPSTVENLEELRNCTTGVLNQYCRDHKLKIGGTKKEIMDRVWRHIQGEGSDEDKGRGGKVKKEKKVADKHICSGFKTDGSPCQLSGTEDKGECWFCYKHITDADKFLEASTKKSQAGPSNSATSAKKKGKKKVTSEAEETEEDEESVPVPVSRKNKGKKPIVVEELVSEDEE
jgi:hypothetical protein